MSTYGIDYYDTAYYGANTLTQFTAAPFNSLPYDYQAIQLTWVTPGGSWDYMRLIRHAYGFPVNADDGDVLFEITNGETPTFYKDTGQYPSNVGLEQGHCYYYSLFVRETTYNSWQRAGDVIGISVKNYGTVETMYDYLPSIVTSQVPYDTAVEKNNDFLKRFLKLFAFQLDLYKTQTENVMNRYDIDNVNGLLLPAFMQQYGFAYEPTIGMKQSRILLKNAALLYQNKGTKAGTNEFVKAYAGYDNIITMGRNLMLDQNDSSFEQSIGSWAPLTNCTLARHSVTDSPTIDPYNELSAQPDFPNLKTGTLQVTASGSGNIEFIQSGSNPTKIGIPVTETTAYCFSFYAQTETTSRSITSKIYWYDKNGTFLSSSTAGSSISDTSGSWTKGYVTATAPSTAVYAIPYIKIASAASGEKHFFDALQFEIGTTPSEFQEARQIEITLIANRINELINPNFASPENGWSVTNGTIAATSDPADILGVNGSITNSLEAGEMYASAAGLVTLTSSAMPVFANNQYTFSIHACATDLGDSPTPVTPYISWYDSTNALISTTQGNPLTATSTLVRPFVSDVAPDTAVTAKAGITWTATGAGSPTNGNQVVVDSGLFEKSAFVNSYFDGSNGVAELSDLFWEGSANQSRSHYYRNRFAVQSRLVKKLPDWTHYGSTFELFFAQPN